MSRWGALVAIAVALSGDAFSQTPPSAPTANVSRADAQAYMTEYVSARPLLGPCPIGALFLRRVDSVEINDTGLIFTCGGNGTRSIVFSDAPNAWIVHGMWAGRRFNVCVGRQVSDCVRREMRFYDMQDPQAFVNAWAGLQRPPPPLDPLTDTAFQEALRRAASEAVDRSEDNRRTQVQAEALIVANRVEAALAAYRAALDVSPDWAAGHYNAALVAGQLENYTLAITEMRRYLYLAPNAPDARAAQDQIYRWEALLTQQQ